MIDKQRSIINNIEYIILLHMFRIAVSSYKACRKNSLIYIKDGFQNFKVTIIQSTAFQNSLIILGDNLRGFSCMFFFLMMNTFC